MSPYVASLKKREQPDLSSRRQGQFDSTSDEEENRECFLHGNASGLSRRRKAKEL